jgi:hypothetical protein
MSGLYVFLSQVRRGLTMKPFFVQGNTKHQEIFSFERVTEGRYEGKEWEDIVKPVIEKWGGFVEAYL